MNDRLLPFERIENFRDFGGYQTADGLIARGQLFRSGLHARATDDDLAHMASLGIGTIVDLRRRSERLAQPSRRPQGWTGQVVESDLGGDGEAPHIQFLQTQSLTAQSARDYMGGAYTRMPYEPNHLALFRAYFEALAQGQGPVLIHCAAGKDRTGLLAALTHRFLGVHDDDLMADYLATNDAINLDARIDQMGQRLQKVTGKTVEPEAVVAFLGVEPAFLDQAWRAIKAESGNVETYFEQALGLQAAEIARIRKRLLA
jgi:protein-tyrosine phosphatase